MKRKVVASSFGGKRYGDNSKAIIEALHEIDNSIDIVWIKDNKYTYSVPNYIRVVNKQSIIRRYYEYTTAKVWIDTHYLPTDLIRRKKQMFIETWHGGLSIKKVGYGNADFEKNNKKNPGADRTAKFASVCISNSSHLDHVYRDELNYKGPIYKCGYPRNDILFADNKEIRKKVCRFYNIPDNKKIILYVPTFRDGERSYDSEKLYRYLYGIDFDLLCSNMSKKFKGDWIVLVKLHPGLIMSGINICDSSNTIDATQYTDIQDLIMACDICISDYSSTIFEAAVRKVPCFTFARDFEQYKEKRGVEFEMEELPFPYAVDNEELMRNIAEFDYNDYLKKWEEFKIKTGLYETGHASYDVAMKIKDYINGKQISWD
ncbi:MAG: CDP-glycerol glycerophosphotransferase family protein [Oscillospiraceae bacterium]|nr:CDP-glycerol glycerophosphotransferase family protein [Oscillospiraceae bacterium]